MQGCDDNSVVLLKSMDATWDKKESRANLSCATRPLRAKENGFLKLCSSNAANADKLEKDLSRQQLSPTQRNEPHT